MEQKKICKDCANLMRWDEGEYSKDHAKCIYETQSKVYTPNVTKCSHFKKKVVPDKQLRADIKKELSHGKNPRKQPNPDAWKGARHIEGVTQDGL